MFSCAAVLSMLQRPKPKRAHIADVSESLSVAQCQHEYRCRQRADYGHLAQAERLRITFLVQPALDFFAAAAQVSDQGQLLCLGAPRIGAKPGRIAMKLDAQLRFVIHLRGGLGVFRDIFAERPLQIGSGEQRFLRRL